MINVHLPDETSYIITSYNFIQLNKQALKKIKKNDEDNNVLIVEIPVEESSDFLRGKYFLILL